MTTNNAYLLKVTVTDWSSNVYTAYYDHFQVASESDNYRLDVSGYDPATSTLSDALTSEDYSSFGMSFSTKDKDNDHNPSLNTVQIKS